MRLPAIGLLVLSACSAPVASAPPGAPAPHVARPSVAAIPSSTPSSMDALPEPIQHEVAAEPDDDVRVKLLAMLAEDQSVRTGIPLPGDDRTPEELFAAMGSVDQRNSARMREILDEHGWPGWSLVGEDGADAAWALIQHADLRPDLQEEGLAYLRGAVEAGDASPGQLAYLIDRVLVAKNLPQIYGTQLGAGPDGELAPRTPIEDAADVDVRRAAVGLGTLEEYFEEFRRAVGEPSASP